MSCVRQDIVIPNYKGKQRGAKDEPCVSARKVCQNKTSQQQKTQNKSRIYLLSGNCPLQ